MTTAQAKKMEVVSSELGTLWMSYQFKSCTSKILSKFARDTYDHRAKRLLEGQVRANEKFQAEIRSVFKDMDAVIPIGFTENDVFYDAPALYDDTFNIMFLRLMSKVRLMFNVTHLSMTYKDMGRKFYEGTIRDAEEVYRVSTDYLMQKGVLAKPPYVTVPKEAEFAEETKYMSGLQFGRNKRALNTLEVTYVCQTIELNITRMQLMTGFAQVAKEREVRDYFTQGKDLAKKIISLFSDVLLQSDIQPPSTWAGKATDSTTAPFSDKLMMYCTNILCSFAMGNNALGMSFSSRSDLPVKLAMYAREAFTFARKGGRIMVKHKWLEEPPQMEDRNRLIYSGNR